MEKQLKKGRCSQISFKYKKILILFIGTFMAINMLSMVAIYKDQALLIAPYRASTVLLFGIEQSPLAKSRNLIMGNLFGAISAFFLLTVLVIIIFFVDLQ